MKYFTFTARCALHDVDLEYLEPEGFEPDLTPIEVEPEGSEYTGDTAKEYELEFASRWQCPVFLEIVANIFIQVENDELPPQEDEEREHWEFVAQNSEEAER
jgi:hypothetical protein